MRYVDSAVTQTCPNCQRVHDVSVYVSGQRVLCQCGIHFDVRRHDVHAQTKPVRMGVANPPNLNEGIEPTIKPPSRGGSADGPVPNDAPPSAAPVLPGYELSELIGKG